MLYSLEASLLRKRELFVTEQRPCKVFQGVSSLQLFRTGQGSQALSWGRQMGQMSPLAPLGSCFLWMLNIYIWMSISLRVIFDLQCAFVFNFLYTIKLCSTQQAADLDVLGAHRVICLGCTVKPDGCIEIHLSQSVWVD